MTVEQTIHSPSFEPVASPAAKLVEAYGVWEAALRATRTRKQLCYSLCSVVFAILLAVVLYSTFVYLFAWSDSSAEKLAELRHVIFTNSMLIIGASTLLFAFWGLINVSWIRHHHLSAILAIRHEAETNGWVDSLGACGGALDIKNAQPKWQTYEQTNRQFRVGYQIALGIGFALAIAGIFL